MVRVAIGSNVRAASLQPYAYVKGGESSQSPKIPGSPAPQSQSASPRPRVVARIITGHMEQPDNPTTSPGRCAHESYDHILPTQYRASKVAANCLSWMHVRPHLTRSAPSTPAEAHSLAQQLPQAAYSTFFLKEQPSVRRALPPVGWHSTVEQPPQMTTVCAWLKTVVLRRDGGRTVKPNAA